MDNIICSIWTYIQNNPRDFFNILFWIFTALLAYKTFINAKKTLFNPIRSEMVKYQMKVITEFIDLHTSKGLNLDWSIDYRSLIRINYEVDYLLDIFATELSYDNHVFDDLDNSRLNYCKENLAGSFEVVKKENIFSFDTTTIGDFDITRQYVDTKVIKAKEETYKDLPLQRLYFTKKFSSIYFDLLNLRTNPFIPKEIKICVDDIISDITHNLWYLYETLSVNIPNEKASTYTEVYNEFSVKKIEHEKSLENLRNAITKYFKVNTV